MPPIKIVFVRTDTGLVHGSWVGPSEAPPDTPADHIAIEVAVEDTTNYRRKHWTGTEWEPRTNEPATIMTRLEFRDLFTPAERAAIRALVTAEDADVIDANEAMQLAQYVDRTDPRVALYLLMLVSKGAIPMERRDTILAGTPPA